MSGLTVNGLLTSNNPKFRVVRSVDQAISNNSTTVIQFDDKSSNSELFDVGGYFNTSTYKYTPLVAGYYSIHMAVLLESASYLSAGINKNGTFQFGNRAWSESGIYSTGQISGVIYMNGSSDYLEGTVYHNVGSTQNIRGLDAGLGHTYFCGFLIG
tara:strand:- start:52 stop:519 length:468 start_codon:yes stop_codon:yes gene_type:complete